ncbi:structural maintenance of chromosomes protein 5 [Salvia miltiorrhiza]|uniref:structural maintenance of chromosomes protein 5 n=1 Tax=Salvia miltiorrhiza TaxID=226208 RepID=UPI0025ACEF96|nr:structural maintenance of chromosomes protein 5 [Salvia miltiorrhiza]
MADEPTPKRPKISRGDDDYVPGNIIKIEICNFMTFSKLTCKPGSRLNLVIGPNGSGKSSLVCAIALGLGGEPQLLGRAKKIGAYVKRGEESGYTEICLRGESKQEQITITRKIDINHKSEWLFNGKVVGRKVISEVIARFNIQVDNLTQFLPQDRVCEFAKLTPVQLLVETEKAVGDPRLPVLHTNLIKKSTELKKFERAVESNRGSLNQLTAQNAELERDVERVRQREDLLAKAESMKKKLPWLKYDMKKATYQEAKKQEDDAKLKLNEAAKALNDLTVPIEKQRGEKAKHEAKFKQMNGFLDSNLKKRMALLENYERLKVVIKGKFGEVDDLRHQEESRQQRLSKAKEDLAAAETEFANLLPYEPPKEKMEQLNFQIMELQEAAKEIRYEKRDNEKHLNHHRIALKQCMDRLKEMDNVNNKCLQALKNSGAERIFGAYQWVQDHRAEFKREVYGPVLLEVNVTNRLHAGYLEGHVAHYIWKAFITQDSEDRDLLVKNLRSFDVPVINYVMTGNHQSDSFQATDEMRKLGISSRLDQVFEAPHAVKEVLISQFRLDQSYIGSKETDEKADMVSNLGIDDLWTPENHYRWCRSRYGGHVSTNVEAVDQSRLLLCNVDVKEIEILRSKQVGLEDKISTIDATLKSLQATLRQKEDEEAELQREREKIVNIIQKEKRKWRDTELFVNQKRMKLKSIESEDDPDAAIEKIIEQVKELKVQHFQCIVEIKNFLIEAVAYRRSFAENNMSYIELDAKIKDMESNAKQQQKLALQASLFLDQCKRASDNCRKELQDAKRYAESVADITPELQQAFLEMPTTVEELEAAIQDTINQANGILFLNHNILEEYENRQRKIEALTNKQEADEKELKSLLDEIDALKESWLPTLRSLVARINETFSCNFQEMAVAGEVSLDEHGTDFDQYGILIKVKFRQTGQLQVLSAHHQSGGERSVSTILYLVSLQDLTNCPFRVVDEINQGMDPINERKMFQQLVRAASKPNTPQCFLLTPKLLPDLEYSDACSILTVMNGPWIEQPSKVWSGGENWSSIRMQLEKNRC